MSRPTIRVRQPEVDSKQPFANDKLHREDAAKALTRFLKTEPGPLVLTVNAGWGRGKSTFLKMWEKQLKQEGFTTILFDAWATDFSDDPLPALISEIAERAKGDTETEDSPLSKALIVVKKLGPKVVKAAIPVALKVATAGLLRAEDFTEGAVGQLTEDIAKQAIDDFQGDKLSLESFRDALQKLAGAMTQKVDVKDGHRPLVFMIDELDRCRPDYAVRLLERVKHVFAVPGVAFVLALDRMQLTTAVTAVYGAGFDGSGYLKRFFDLEYNLPDPDTESFIYHLLDASGLTEFVGAMPNGTDINAHLSGMLIAGAKLFDLGLRDIEHACRRLVIACRSGSPGRVGCPAYIAFLACLAEHDSDLYERFDRGPITATDVKANLRAQPGYHRLDSEQKTELDVLAHALEGSLKREADRIRVALNANVVSAEDVPEQERFLERSSVIRFGLSMLEGEQLRRKAREQMRLSIHFS